MNLLSVYQNIPQEIDPIAFSLGFFSVRWYALMYLVGFITVYIFLRWRIKKGEAGGIVNKQELGDFMVYSIAGLLLGARLGFVFFYGWGYFSRHLGEIFIPFDFSSREIVGMSGMSYHGGLLGVIASTLFFCRKNKINFWKFSDFVLPAIPAGFFFGRVGNFLNGELYGRITEKWWGMHFDSLIFLRHPSQLYEAIGEGAVLFAIIWIFRNKKYFSGFFLFLYLFAFGVIRFGIEFFRQPDPQVGLIGGLSLGQILCFFMVVLATFILFGKNKKRAILEKLDNY